MPGRWRIKKIAKLKPIKCDLTFSFWIQSKLTRFQVAERRWRKPSRKGLRGPFHEDGATWGLVPASLEDRPA